MATDTWFSVRLLFVSEINGDAHQDRLCEESIIVVQAADEESARAAAQRLALTLEHGYANDRGEVVQWRFVRLMELQDLCEATLTNGTEVWSKLFYESQTHDAEVADSLAPTTTTRH